jgi:hypothetical protein
MSEDSFYKENFRVLKECIKTHYNFLYSKFGSETEFKSKYKKLFEKYKEKYPFDSVNEKKINSALEDLNKLNDFFQKEIPSFVNNIVFPICQSPREGCYGEFCVRQKSRYWIRRFFVEKIYGKINKDPSKPLEIELEQKESKQPYLLKAINDIFKLNYGLENKNLDDSHPDLKYISEQLNKSFAKIATCPN